MVFMRSYGRISRVASSVKSNITFPDNLPISEKREHIAATIKKHQVVVLAGETGSGKTTQLPKICLSIGRGVNGMIGHTQPRRIAARTVANRIAEELNTALGELVGYQVRFTDQVSDKTAIKLMTDGILLAEIQQDPLLKKYDTIIIDEAHERSLNIDFLLGYLKQLLPKRPGLKLIVTSATIDVENFSRHFNNAPVIEVSGRTYPVDVIYRPLFDDEEGGVDINSGVLAAIDEIRQDDTSGDILVFFSGERDILEAALMLRRAQIPHTDILPLYARLSVSEQNKIFHPHKGQRIFLATNVAETALTVPGIRYVIDTGLARVRRYSFRTKVQRLPIEKISQASANQRKGRCGRVSEGVCIRLYSEEDFNQRPAFTDPEILRTNLAAVILQMAQLKLGDVKHFPFVDVPDHRLINDGYKLLQELQAVNAKGKLLPLGRQLARLPVDPRLSRMLVAAKQLGCMREVAVMISALSVQDPRERPANKQQAADEKHRQWWHEKSDFIAFNTLWNAYEEQRQTLSGNQLQKWCKKHYVSPLRMREWRDIHKQLCQAMRRVDIKQNTQAASYEAIHCALLSGFLGNIGHLSEEKNNVGEYLGTRNRRFSIFPGSSQFKKKPKWVVAGQLLETSKLYAHHIAHIQPEWVLQNTAHLDKRHHLEPYYAAKSGQVMAFEKISLYGVVLIDKQRVSYGKINPSLSRELFIRTGLVEGLYGEHGRIKKKTPLFFQHQQQLLKELHDLEAKSRRRDIVVDEQVLFDFYHARVPENITNLQSFEQWRKEIEKEQPQYLFVKREYLMQHDAGNITEAQFPNQLTLSGLTLTVTYHFEPGHAHDGVSLQVPVGVLHLLNETELEWLVPGLLREKCIAMIKGLPKQWRKHFVPVPDAVDKALPYLKDKTQPLTQRLSEQLLRQKNITIPEALWNDIPMDDYYRMNLCVRDEHQTLLDSHRQLSVLRKRYRNHVQEHIQDSGNDFEQTNLQEWNFGERPERWQLQRQGLSILVYPGLQDQATHVNLQLYDNPNEALVDSLQGVVRLAFLQLHETVKYLKKNLLKGRDLGLAVVDIGSTDKVLDDIICTAIKQACFSEPLHSETLVRDKQAYLAAVEAGRAEIVAKAEKLAALLSESLAAVVVIKKSLKQAKNPLMMSYAASDIGQQLQHLFYPGMLFETPETWLQQYPRYLKAIQHRLEKVQMQVNKDRAWIAELEPLWQRFEAKLSEQGKVHYLLSPELQTYRWMLEELRISLFAQTIKTQMPVSVKRLNKQWELC